MNAPCLLPETPRRNPPVTPAPVAPERGVPITRGQRTNLLIARIAAMRAVRQSDLVHATSRAAPVAWARHELRWSLRQLEPGYSMSQLGRLTGDADPTTVRHSIRVVEDRMKADPDYADELVALVAEFAQTEPPQRDPRPVAPILSALELVLANRRLSDRDARAIALSILHAQGIGHD